MQISSFSLVGLSVARNVVEQCLIILIWRREGPVMARFMGSGGDFRLDEKGKWVEGLFFRVIGFGDCFWFC